MAVWGGKMTSQTPFPSVSVQYARTGTSTKSNELGMRVMQERAYDHRGEQYLLIKSPPASGKSRALMFIALDKLNNQGLKQALIIVPERSIGGSFADEPLTRWGFYWDWNVRPHWNLCNVAGIDDTQVAKSKVAAVKQFLASEDRVLVCTHATFRFAVDELGIEAFDDRLLAVDEFHHVSANPDNKLGAQLKAFLAHDKTHIVAMTGSYFRGDAEPVLMPDDEAKFVTVTYTYYEQLNGYDYLKALDLGYFFYSGPWVDSVMKVLDPTKKTILHIPSVNSRESTGDKFREVNEILDTLGSWEGDDPDTGFHLVRGADGRLLKIANLVDDESAKRDRVIGTLKNPKHKSDRGRVDVIIALGMAKEGFDWIWCEHALTVGYRNSLTEIIQIIGRATRDAPGKERARFTNLIAEPDASEQAVAEAINDTLKAIAASLLMEQVLAPRFNFTPKNAGAQDGFDYGEGGYSKDGHNIGFNEATGQLHIEIKGLAQPESPEAARVCKEDLNELVAAFVQDKETTGKGLFDEQMLPEELTVGRMGKIVREKFPTFSDADLEAVRQHAVAALNLTQKAKSVASGVEEDGEPRLNTALIDGVRKYALSVTELDIDLIDSINPFATAYAILSKTMNEASLQLVAAKIAARRIAMTHEEARALAMLAIKFKKERSRLPSLTSADPYERRMAEAVEFLRQSEARKANG